MAFKQRFISRTTAIANAPFFAESCIIAHANGMQDHIGVHFNITDGLALSSAIAETPCFCKKGGVFTYKRNTARFLTRSEMSAVRSECEYQIRTFHEHNLHPTHLDSHHHVHTEWSIFRAIEPVLRENHFSSARISANLTRSSFVKGAYKGLFNSYLRMKKWASTDYFCDISELAGLADGSSAKDAVVEIMTHPDFNSEGVLVDALSGEELGPQIEKVTRLLHTSGFAGVL
jgi:chitin disaccharide deacetylase